MEPALILYAAAGGVLGCIVGLLLIAAYSSVKGRR